MKITHIDHYNITLRPSDLAKVRDFYTGVLGLVEGPRPPFDFPGAWLYGGGEAAILHLAAVHPESASPVDAGKPTGQFDHVSLKTTGLEAARRRLTQAGVAFDERPVPNWNLHQIFLTDPAGLRVELTFDMERERNAPQ